MLQYNYHFLILRKRTSYLFKKDMESPDSWEGDHNAQHNMEDIVRLYRGDVVLAVAPAQTVANMPGCRHTDTIIPGIGLIVWDADRRNFKGHVHGFAFARDQDGQLIDENSVETVIGKNGAPIDFARWIFLHSTEKMDPAPEGEFTRYAWSAGCAITTKEAQANMFNIGTEQGFKRFDYIPYELVEV